MKVPSTKENFDKKVITINQTDLDEIMKDNKIINQSTTFHLL